MARQRGEPTKEERLQDARESLKTMVDKCLNGCEDHDHRPSEEAARTLIEGSHLIPLSGVVREAFLKVYVSNALHSVEEPSNPLAAMMGSRSIPFDKMFAKLGDTERIMFGMVIAAAVAQELGVDLLAEGAERPAHAGVPLRTGQYA